MAQSFQELAGEILKMERLNEEGVLSEEQQSKWRELVIELMVQLVPSADHRRELRVPGVIEAAGSHGGNDLKFIVENISRQGLSAVGCFGRARAGEEVTIREFSIGQQPSAVELRCRIAWVENLQDSPNQAVGLEIVGGGADAGSGFFRRVFYPLYLQYLDNLSKQRL